MDIYRVGVDLKFVNKLGETLSTEEKYPTLPQNLKTHSIETTWMSALWELWKPRKLTN
jgi:hypothetical protein